MLHLVHAVPGGKSTVARQWKADSSREENIFLKKVFSVGTKRSSLFAYRVTLILNDRVIIKGVQDIMKKKIPDGPTERERHV